MNLYNRVENFKYLGHHLDADLKDDRDILRQCQSLYATGNMLISYTVLLTSESSIILPSISICIESSALSDSKVCEMVLVANSSYNNKKADIMQRLKFQLRQFFLFFESLQFRFIRKT